MGVQSYSVYIQSFALHSALLKDCQRVPIKLINESLFFNIFFFYGITGVDLSKSMPLEIIPQYYQIYADKKSYKCDTFSCYVCKILRYFDTTSTMLIHLL